MAMLPRAGGRLLARLRCPFPDPGSSAAPAILSSHQEFTPGFWGASAVRHMTGGEEPSPRSSGSPPPPPGSSSAREGDQPPNPSSSSSPKAASASASSEPSSSSSSTAPSASKTSAPKSSRKARKDTSSDDDSEKAPESSDPDAGYVHAHFSRSDEMRKLQPLLEEAERRHAFDGLSVDGGGGVIGSGGGWSYLYDSPPGRLLGSLLQSLRAASRSVLLPGVLARLQTMSERMVREEVESNFDAQEFLDGVRSAVPTFFDAVAAADSESLRRMASTKAVEALERDRRRLREDMGLEVKGITTAVEYASIGGVNLWGPASVRAFDPAWAKELTSDVSKSWLVVVVHLDVRMDVTYRRVKGAAAAGGSGVPGAGSGLG
ncbi:hypothetical protein Agub_g6239, partial [Astrephomene gubernaculifera]